MLIHPTSLSKKNLILNVSYISMCPKTEASVALLSVLLIFPLSKSHFEECNFSNMRMAVSTFQHTTVIINIK